MSQWRQLKLHKKWRRHSSVLFRVIDITAFCVRRDILTVTPKEIIVAPVNPCENI